MQSDREHKEQRLACGLWERKLDDVEALPDLRRLPLFGAVFFFSHMGRFRLPFVVLTLVGIFSNLFKFSTVYLLSKIISAAPQLAMRDIFYIYAPLWIGAMTCAEVLDYFTRRYSEALPLIYAEQLKLRFHLAFLELRFDRLANFSKERLQTLVNRYVANVQAFLNDWCWSLTSKATRLVLVLGILAAQSPAVLALNVLYMLIFLGLSLRISSRFSALAREYSQRAIESYSTFSSFALSLNTVRRLGVHSFFRSTYTGMLRQMLTSFFKVRKFHAGRWLLQLNLFNALYIGTLLYGVYQVKLGLRELGFLVLIKWAFDELWNILVYIIEYYVSLVQQREDALVISRELAPLFSASQARTPLEGSWKSIALDNVRAEFVPESCPERKVCVSIPQLRIGAGEKVGIVGPSGSGKTTVLNILLNLARYEGGYFIDGRSAADLEIPAGQMTLINSQEPLFKLSLEENVLLGRSVDASLLHKVLAGTEVDAFAPELKGRVGSAGFNLSAGEEQRIRLARGLLQESACYLLDEPLNGIDGAAKKRIIAFMRSFLAARTVVLVTHNAGELELIDRVYEIREGLLCPASAPA